MHSVGLALHEHSMLYETAIAAEVFGVDRSELSPTGDWYDLVICTPDGSPARWLPDATLAVFWRSPRSTR